jgi:hypothetical protein
MGLVWLWSWRIGPRRADARSPLRQMLDTGPPAARRMGEAGFIGYAPGRQVLEATCHLLRRGGGNGPLLKEPGDDIHPDEEDGTKGWLWPRAKQQGGEPPVALRLLV